MAELILGTPEDKTAWANQMRGINKRFPQGLVIGRFGRTAMYAAYGHPAQPINVRHTPEELAAKDIEPETPSDYLRDIDMVGAPYLFEGGFDLLKPHHIDQGMDVYLGRNQQDPTALRLFGMTEEYDEVVLPASAALLTPRTRMLDGVPVNTPLVGVQQQIERVVGTGVIDPARQASYDAGRAEFDAFAESVRAVAPDEFLPDDVMAPLVELALRNAW